MNGQGQAQEGAARWHHDQLRYEWGPWLASEQQREEVRRLVRWGVEHGLVHLPQPDVKQEKGKRSWYDSGSCGCAREAQAAEADRNRGVFRSWLDGLEG
jgi:hypothetical protein